MLWLIPCQLYSGYLHPMPAMLSGLSHASYALATLQLAVAVMLWLFTSHASYALAYPMPAMLWLFTSHASYALAYPMPAMLCLLARIELLSLQNSIPHSCLFSNSSPQSHSFLFSHHASQKETENEHQGDTIKLEGWGFDVLGFNCFCIRPRHPIILRGTHSFWCISWNCWRCFSCAARCTGDSGANVRDAPPSAWRYKVHTSCTGILFVDSCIFCVPGRSAHIPVRTSSHSSSP